MVKRIELFDDLENNIIKKSKIAIAKSHGYDVAIVWESDWINDRDNVLTNLKEFLNAPNNNQ